MTFGYSDFLTHMVTVLEIADTAGVTAFTNIVPLIISRTEDLIYKDSDMDFLVMRDVDVSQSTTNGLRAVPIPATMLVVESVAIITPANSVPTVAGAQRIPLLRTTADFINLTWPQETQTAAPNLFNGGYWAIFDQEQATPAQGEDEPTPLPSSIMVAPTPDNTYHIEYRGIIQPVPLSASNTPTFLTSNFYPLFFAAAMTIGAAYQRDWGMAGEDDPRLATTWAAEYEKQKLNAIRISKRQKGVYSSLNPPAMPQAVPTPTPGPARAGP